MKKIAEKLADAIYANNSNITELQYKTIKFGLQCFIGEITKVAIYCIIFFLLGYLYESLIAMLFFCTLRLIAGGYHEDSYWKCFTTSLITFILIVYISVNININLYFKILIAISSLVLLYYFSPVDHPNKPIISEKRRKKFKISSVIFGTIFCLISFVLPPFFGNVALLSIFAESISLPFGKYKNRKGERLIAEG